MRIPLKPQVGSRNLPGDLLGAFGDLPILLPLLVLLARVPGYSLPVLLASAALASFAAFWIFRTPVSIQPLKSIAIAAVALGASPEEIRISGMMLGLFFLVWAVLRKNPLPVPEPVVRSVQTALGVLLIMQGYKSTTLTVPELAVASLAVTVLFTLDRRSGIPFLGIGALLAFFEACWSARAPSPLSSMTGSDTGIRMTMVAGLLLPQLALTSTNSVAGARLALDTYFPEKSLGPTLERRLMGSIGLGNILTGLIHGMPFCHGAGGITAHIRAGARSRNMNLILALLLGVLAWVSYRTQFVPVLETRVGFVLLTLIGLHHLNFAGPLIKMGTRGRILAIGSGLTVGITGNLLAVIGFAWVFLLRKGETAHD
jgi:SulP family sulfate permease